MYERVTYKAECGHETTSAVGVPRKRFCSMDCAAEYMDKRSNSFAEATSRPAGKPKDGITYAASKRGGSR